MKITRYLNYTFYMVILNWFILISVGYSETYNSNTFVLKITDLNEPGIAHSSALKANSMSKAKLEMISKTASSSKSPRQRNPELSEELLVIKGVNKEGKEIMRTLIQDPRIVRAESVDENGRIISTRFFQNNIEFPVSLPVNEKLSSIEIHHPHWNGERYILQIQGKLKIDK